MSEAPKPKRVRVNKPVTLEKRAEYRKTFVGKKCLCGAQATTFTSSVFSCERCKSLDASNDEFHRRLAGKRMAWLLCVAREVDAALDAWWARRGIPEPVGQFHYQTIKP